MTDLGRVVDDTQSGMGYQFRARVMEVKATRWRKRRRWVFQIDRHFMRWSVYSTSRKFYDPIVCLDRANAWLDSRSEWPGVTV